jgi:transposase-like protein
MVGMSVVCPYCQSDHIVKRGKTETDKQRYRCHNEKCSHHSFLLDPAYKGRLPEIKQQVIEMSLNGSGVRDTARVLQISTATVIQELKKKGQPSRR